LWFQIKRWSPFFSDSSSHLNPGEGRSEKPGLRQEVSGFGYLVFSPGLSPQVSLSETNESEDSGRA
jgi:hypothetical protein